MKRRDFLQMAGAGVAAVLSPGLWAASAPAASGRTLVLVELKGGNDGLNTVIPFGDADYYRARPNLAVPRDRVLAITPDSGFHPALEPWMDIWKAKELALVQGVGYPQPNRSHFRSIAIWETGSDSDEYLAQGWLTRMLPEAERDRNRVADGLVVGREIGPLGGGDLQVIAFRNPKRFLRQAKRIEAVESRTENRSLRHILQVKQDIHHAGRVLQQQLEKTPELGVEFPNNRFGREMQLLAGVISSGISLPVVKVSLSGFDTHSNQQGTHQRLLKELGEGIAAFRKAMQRAGLWDRVLVATYSEFGRRVKENGSRGTDHGTAAPHFLFGGKVRGGLYGEAPSLTDLDNGDLRHRVDYRSLYASIGEGWFSVPAERYLRGSFPKLSLIG
jgi:uncharacterized protein (DUF1501 family)